MTGPAFEQVLARGHTRCVESSPCEQRSQSRRRQRGATLAQRVAERDYADCVLSILSKVSLRARRFDSRSGPIVGYTRWSPDQRIRRDAGSKSSSSQRIRANRGCHATTW